jgi:hypothetical protein
MMKGMADPVKILDGYTSVFDENEPSHERSAKVTSQCLLPGALQGAAQCHLDPTDSRGFHPHSREITAIFSYTQPI